MIEISEAAKIIDDSSLKLPKILVPLEKAVGRVLRQKIVADADFPPFNRVMMDGIAINFNDYKEGVKIFSIKGIQSAGSPQLTLELKGNCLEAMTGAIAPIGSDTVIPYEDIEIDSVNNTATVQIDKIKKGQNVHQKGIDKKKGDLLISEGTLIGAPEIAVAASVGLMELLVTKNPSVAIISTGNELVEIHETTLPN